MYTQLSVANAQTESAEAPNAHPPWRQCYLLVLAGTQVISADSWHGGSA